MYFMRKTGHMKPSRQRWCNPSICQKRESTREHAHVNAPIAGKASFGHWGQATARPQALGRQSSLAAVLVGFILTCEYAELLLNDTFPRQGFH